MNERGKSDRPIVPGKPTNKDCGAPWSAEGVEERVLAEGNSGQQNRDRAQDRAHLQSALDRIRQAARKNRELRFTTLWRHVYDIRRLREEFFAMKKTAAAGVDGVTWQQSTTRIARRIFATSRNG
jgi:RNA-directed DNA polymerase